MSKKKKKQAVSEELQANYLATEEGFEAAIAEAEQIEDPAEKILRMREIQEEIYNTIQHESGEIDKLVERMHPMGGKQAALYFGMAIPTVFVGSLAYLFRKQANQRNYGGKLHEEQRPHADKLKDYRHSLSELMAVVVEEHVDEISLSPRAAEVLADSRLARVFAEATVKNKIAEAEAKAAAEAEAAKAAAVDGSAAETADPAESDEAGTKPAEKEKAAEAVTPPAPPKDRVSGFRKIEWN